MTTDGGALLLRENGRHQAQALTSHTSGTSSQAAGNFRAFALSGRDEVLGLVGIEGGRHGGDAAERDEKK